MIRRRTVTTIVCQGPCLTGVVSRDGLYTDKQIRRTAKELGWHCDDTGDYCPKCAAKRKGEEQ